MSARAEWPPLKPCPFCGGKATHLTHRANSLVHCVDGGCPTGPCTTAYATPAEAAAAWNTRANLYRAYGAAAQDPTFMEDMRAVTAQGDDLAARLDGIAALVPVARDRNDPHVDRWVEVARLTRREG